MKAYVYKFYEKNEVVYIGHTTNMKKRMCVHYAPENDYQNHVLTNEQISKVDRIEFVEVRTLTDSKLLEAYLIATIRPRYNKDYNEDGTSFQLVTGELEWKEWLVPSGDNPHQNIRVFKDGELLYEVPKMHDYYEPLAKMLGLTLGMNIPYGSRHKDGDYEVQRFTTRRKIRTNAQHTEAKYRFEVDRCQV